jgi:Protein of unknown function (DUF2971)
MGVRAHHARLGRNRGTLVPTDSPYGAPIPEELEAAVHEYRAWDLRQLAFEEKKTTVTEPLYQYTGWSGLCGIIESRSVWFTDYRYLNDRSELWYGVKVAREALAAVAQATDERVGIFLQTVRDRLVPRKFVGSLDFFTASFTAQRDDPGQWERYGDEGCGFALGFAPKMFAVLDGAGFRANEMSFVGPVRYDEQAIFARHMAAIEKAASIFLTTCNTHPKLMADKSVGWPFIQDMANTLIASPLIWNCITSKHADYAHEREVRLVLMNQTINLSTDVKTRMRGSERVPYVAHPFTIDAPGAIHEIVVGPSAEVDAEDKVRHLLASCGLPDVDVTRSKG